jgi:hypothetical protein
MSEEHRMSTPFKVQRKDTPVMFMRAKEDSAAAIQQAWANFERVVGVFVATCVSQGVWWLRVTAF